MNKNWSQDDLQLDSLIEVIKRGEIKRALDIVKSDADINAHDHGPEPLVQDGTQLKVDRKGTTALVVAAQRGESALVRELLRVGADVHAKEKTKVPPTHRTALSYASENGHLEVVQLLLDAGARLEDKDRHIKGETGGKTALCYACERGHLRIVEIFCRSGANVNHCCSDGTTPLILASQAGATPIIQLLIRQGSAIDYCDPRGWSALHAAVFRGHTEAIKCLLECKANPNAGSELRNPPLVTSALNNDYPSAELLLKNGANIDVQDGNGMTATMFAALYPDGRLLKLCLSKAPSLNLTDTRGRTATMIAEAEEALENLKLLQHAQFS